jgi:hypothetical protein
LGDERLKHLLATRFEPGPNIHSHEQNNNAAFTPLIRQCIVDYIKEQGRLHGEFYATRIMIGITKYELIDEEKDAVDLPSNFTKISMYERHCYESGWAIKVDNKGRYPPVVKYAKRNIDEILSQDTIEISEVVGWTSFRQIWKESCTKIQIRQPCSGTCGEYSIFRNAFGYRQSCQNSTTTSDPDSNIKINSDNEDEYDDDGGIVKDITLQYMEAS